MNKRQCNLIVIFVHSMLALFAANAPAQSYPSRQITFVAPYAIGSLTDTLQRVAVIEASKILGQTIVYESRPGANNRLSLTAIRNAPADGYTLAGVLDGLIVLQPLVDPAFKLQPVQDYMPVAVQIESALAFISSAARPYRDIDGLRAFAKANPGKLNMAVGIGGSSHVFAERIRAAMGIDFAIIGYKGSAQSYIDLAAGRIDLVLATDKSLVESGKLVALATTGRERWSSLPKVPTLTEAGVPVAGTLWLSVIAHKNTPPEIVARLNSAFSAAVRTPEFIKKIEGTGYAAMPAMAPDAIVAYIKSEMAAMEPVIRQAGIKLE
jgi:tripartite-type tricarboxylate transporter receptor subunit TctC